MGERSDAFIVSRHHHIHKGIGKRQVIGISNQWQYGTTFCRSAYKVMHLFSVPGFRLWSRDSVMVNFAANCEKILHSAFSCDFEVGRFGTTYPLDPMEIQDPRLIDNDHGMFVVDVTNVMMGKKDPIQYAFFHTNEDASKTAPLGSVSTLVPPSVSPWQSVPCLTPISASDFIDIYYGEDHQHSKIWRHKHNIIPMGDDVAAEARKNRDEIKELFKDMKLMSPNLLRLWFPKMFDGVDIVKRQAHLARQAIKKAEEGKFGKNKPNRSRSPRGVRV